MTIDPAVTSDIDADDHGDENVNNEHEICTTNIEKLLTFTLRLIVIRKHAQSAICISHVP